MKKQLLILIILLSIYNISYADCPTADVYLTSQAQIDAFPSYYSGCKTIDFNVTIKEDVDGDITNLSGLSDIETINGNFYITENSGLTNLNGLYDLTTVNGAFYIFENSGLQNLNGLGVLSTITGDYFYIGHNDNLQNLSGLNSLNTVAADNLYIGHNDNLTNLNGLDNLNAVVGALVIEYNENLANLSGLSNLSTIGGNLLIGDNYDLSHISDLSNLSSVGEFLWIGPNQNLPSLNGLENLNSIGKGIWIGRNNSLTDITALSGITTLGDYLMIDENNSLQSLNGLQNISSLSTLLWIGNNTSLTDIAMDNLNSVDGSLLINNNALVNLDGLSSLNSINGYIHIIGNYELNNIEGIGQINHNTINELSIYANENLAACSVASVCSYLEVPAPNTDIHDNAINCNNDSEIETQCAPLPVKWGEPLLAKTNGSSIVLTGSIAQQFNTDNFIVEHSHNGIDFEKLSIIKGEGISLSEKSYQYIDQHPFVGDNYYRIKITDYSEEFTYSDVVYETQTALTLAVFPNPVVDRLTITSDIETEVMIFSMLGEKVFHGTVHIGANSIAVDTWVPGIYNIVNDGKTSKIIKVE